MFSLRADFLRCSEVVAPVVGDTAGAESDKSFCMTAISDLFDQNAARYPFGLMQSTTFLVKQALIRYQ